jgi:predicted short-subunit dehydrogenase-like oxidoreductase (DUF2520 family)
MASADPHPIAPPLIAERSVAILGAGKVGSAVGAALRAAGVRVAAVTAASVESAERAAAVTGAQALADNAAAASRADIVLLTVRDDAIHHVAAEVAAAGGFRPGQLVAHMSGALPLSALEPASDAGALVGCAHPLQTFATYEQAARDLPGSVFGVTAGPGAEPLLGALVEALGGTAVEVADDRKTVYHAAAVVASNYLVALEDVAVRLLVDAGFAEAEAMSALAPLVRRTVTNLGELGTTGALTGPIVRGDVETVRRHLEALEALSPDLADLYRTLGRETLAIAIRRGTLDAQALAELREALGGATSSA